MKNGRQGRLLALHVFQQPRGHELLARQPRRAAPHGADVFDAHESGGQQQQDHQQKACHQDAEDRAVRDLIGEKVTARSYLLSRGMPD